MENQNVAAWTKRRLLGGAAALPLAALTACGASGPS